MAAFTHSLQSEFKKSFGDPQDNKILILAITPDQILDQRFPVHWWTKKWRISKFVSLSQKLGQTSHAVVCPLSSD